MMAMEVAAVPRPIRWIVPQNVKARVDKIPRERAVLVLVVVVVC